MKKICSSMAIVATAAVAALAGCGGGPRVEVLVPVAAPTITDGSYNTAQLALIWWQQQPEVQQQKQTDRTCRDGYAQVVTHEAYMGENVPTLEEWLQVCVGSFVARPLY